MFHIHIFRKNKYGFLLKPFLKDKCGQIREKDHCGEIKPSGAPVRSFIDVRKKEGEKRDDIYFVFCSQ